MKKKQITAILLAMAIVCQPVIALADAAPDGKTDASTTAAAQNGAWESWCEEWENIKGDWTIVSMSPGADETQMNFAWYTPEGQASTFRYGTTEDLSDAVDAQVNVTAAQPGYVSSKVTLTGLVPGTTYYYAADDKEVASFTTDADTSEFSFIFVGDPQIGSSNEEKAKKPEHIQKPSFATAQSESVRSDTFNWNHTLESAYAKTGNTASFVLSAGDQIQTKAKRVEDDTISEIEYTGYLSPKLLKSLPVATTVGNHDADNSNYLYHFNIANLDTLGSNEYVGGDYYFTYGDALFIMLNTQDTNVGEHKQFIEKVTAANPDCKWKIATLHQDIYGSAEHSNEPEIVALRYALAPVFEENGIDVVLTGHDHAYSRSKLLKGGVDTTGGYTDDEFDEMLDRDLDVGDSEEQIFIAPANIADDTQDAQEQRYLEYLQSVMDEDAVIELTDAQDVAINPEGIMYLTAGSSSGSKYYDLVPRQQTYIASRWQQDVPTYSVVDVTETTFTVNTYRTDTGEAIDTQFMIVKSADHEQLSALITEAEALSADKYTEESYDVLRQALEGAKKVDGAVASTTEMITNAHTALKSAIDLLEEKKAPEENKVPEDNKGTTDNKGTADNNGTTDNKGTADNKGATDNKGTADNNGTADNKETSDNKGTDNKGSADSKNTSDNAGTKDQSKSAAGNDGTATKTSAAGVNAKPAESTVKTGDVSDIMLPVTYMLVALSVIAGVVYYLKKRA